MLGMSKKLPMSGSPFGPGGRGKYRFRLRSRMTMMAMAKRIGEIKRSDIVFTEKVSEMNDKGRRT